MTAAAETSLPYRPRHEAITLSEAQASALALPAHEGPRAVRDGARFARFRGGRAAWEGPRRARDLWAAARSAGRAQVGGVPTTGSGRQVNLIRRYPMTTVYFVLGLLLFVLLTVLHP